MYDAGHDLAEHYADLLNLFVQAGIDFPEDELSRIDDDLSQTDWIVENVDGRWEVIQGSDSANLTIHHSPKGGVYIQDRLYRSQAVPADGHVARRLNRGAIDPRSIRAITQRFAFVPHDEADRAMVLRHADAMLWHHGDLALHRIDELARTMQGVLESAPDDAVGPIKKQLSLYHRMLDRVGPAVRLSWTPYHGTSGGEGWKSTVTGEVRYQREKPSEHEESAPEQVAQQPPAQQVEQMPNATVTIEEPMPQQTAPQVAGTAESTAKSWLAKLDLPEPLKEKYAADMDAVLAKMPPKCKVVALAAIAERGGGMFFLADSAAVTAELEHQTGKKERAKVGGFVSHHPGGDAVKVFLDGGSETDPKNPEKAQGIYAHEMWHAVDVGRKYSSDPKWESVWKREIFNGKRPLTMYARTSATEGWAELGRAIHLKGVAACEADFPKSIAFMRAKGLL